MSKCVIQQYQEHFRRPLRIDARSILVEVCGIFKFTPDYKDLRVLLNWYPEIASIYNVLFQVDGDFTLSENICDIDGLNVASTAFEGLRDLSANDLVHLPNNPYTPQQLFFINTAQVSFSIPTNFYYCLSHKYCSFSGLLFTCRSSLLCFVPWVRRACAKSRKV